MALPSSSQDSEQLQLQAAVPSSLSDLIRVRATRNNPTPLQAAEQQLVDAVDEHTLQAYLTVTVTQGDVLFVKGIPGPGADTDLGLLELQMEHMLSISSSKAVYLAEVRQMADSCLQGRLPANRLVVLKFPALWLSDQDLTPTALVAKITHAAFALKQEYITMRRCHESPHVVQAGCSTCAAASAGH